MRSTKQVVLCTAVALAVAGCADTSTDLNIGMRQTALDLEFKVAKLAKPVPRQVIVQYLPAPPAPAPLPPLPPQVIVVPGPDPVLPPPPDPCPAAAFDAVPDLNAALKPVRPPAVGTYTQRLSGSAKVTVGASTLSAPLPQTGTVAIGKSVTAAPPTTDVLVNSSDSGPEYDVVTTVSDKYQVTERFRATAKQIELVKRVTKEGTRTTTFTPTPAIPYYVYGGEGTTWTAAGVDLDTGVAVVMQGATGARQRIDLCGKLVDTYSVTLKETLVDVQTGEQVMTSESDPSTLNIATQYGGIFVKRHVHQTTQRKDEATGEDVSVELSWTTIANRVGPDPKSRG